MYPGSCECISLNAAVASSCSSICDLLDGLMLLDMCCFLYAEWCDAQRQEVGSVWVPSPMCMCSAMALHDQCSTCRPGPGREKNWGSTDHCKSVRQHSECFLLKLKMSNGELKMR